MAKRLRTKNDFKETMYLNSETYSDYVDRLRRIALSVFEWENLPETMDSRYLERCLYYKGQAGLLYSDKYGFINTNACSAGYINIYGLPTELNCYSYDFTENRKLYVANNKLEKDEVCILAMNNWDRTPTSASISLFAYRLAEAQRTIDTNIKNQKFPALVLTTDAQRLTLKNVYEQWDGNSPVIYGDKNILAPESIKSINTEAPYVADKLMDYKRQIWNEALTMLGINNIEAEKKERLITDETSSNNELINMNLQNFLAPRQLAAKQFNDMFGTDIKVKVRSDLHNIIKENESINVMKEVENE